MKQNEPHDPNGSGDPPAVDKERIYGNDGVDHTLIRWMPSLTPTERLQMLQQSVGSLSRLSREASRTFPA
jgi:hypothetical protein